MTRTDEITFASKYAEISLVIPGWKRVVKSHAPFILAQFAKTRSNHKMHQRRRAIFLGLVASALLTTSTYAQEITSDTYGDWQMVCDQPQSCRIAQAIVQPASNRLILQAKVFAGDEPTLLVTFPLGILLSSGWGFQIDSGRQTTLPFEICNQDGCHVGVPLDRTLLQAMQRGQSMQVTFYDAARKSVNVDLSLIGFTAGWQEISVAQ